MVLIFLSWLVWMLVYPIVGSGRSVFSEQRLCLCCSRAAQNLLGTEPQAPWRALPLGVSGVVQVRAPSWERQARLPAGTLQASDHFILQSPHGRDWGAEQWSLCSVFLSSSKSQIAHPELYISYLHNGKVWPKDVGSYSLLKEFQWLLSLFKTKT